MAQNYARKSSAKLDQKFTEGSIFKGFFNERKSEFVGANTVRVFAVATSGLITYDGGLLQPLTAANNGIVLAENTFNDYTITRRVGKSIRQDNALAIMNPAHTAAATQKAFIEEQEIPQYDKYVLSRIIAGATNAPKTWTAGSATLNGKKAVYGALSVLRDASVPLNSLRGFATQDFVSDALDNMPDGDRKYEDTARGKLPLIGGIAFETVPSSYFPTGTVAAIASNQSVMAPVVLNDAKVITNVPDYNGINILLDDLSDAFVLANKANGIVVINKAA